MSTRFRRPVILAAVVLIGWYVVVVLLWAVQPLTDSIPIGVDHSVAKYEPAGRQISKTVDCNTLFSGSARDAGPLPQLPQQPKGYAALRYPPRAACSAVQRDARVVFGLDTVFVLVALGGLYAVNRRYGHETPQAAASHQVSALPA
jgi:hypothetical protein